MNSKVSFVNLNYLKENFKKSKGVIFLFVLIIPIFTYLFMLMLNSSRNTIYFPQLGDLSTPALLGMYIIPFITAVSLFNFVFKKDSVDFINSLPLKRSTIFITNIVGGIALFFLIFLTTSLFMWIVSGFFTNLVIPSTMYFHFFLTFFVTYTFTFIASSLTLSLTGSRLAHVALTLILIFVPSFLSDFYDSVVYDGKIYPNFYSPCDIYDTECKTYEINNELTVEQSYKFENGQTLPYKYVSVVPRAIFGMNTNEVTFNTEISSVYNLSSIIRMILLSVLYFAIGLYLFVRRKMEIAESTFKNEHVHQIVKCMTIFPLCLGAIAVFAQESTLTVLLIFTAIIVTIYAVYDLITRRNSGQFWKSLIYLLGLVLSTIVIYFGVGQLARIESSKQIEKDNVSHLGIAPDRYFNPNDYNAVFDSLDYKIKDDKIIDFIFDNTDTAISSNTSEIFAIRITLKNGKDYYFNMRLSSEKYDEMLELLDENTGYADKLKSIPYDQVYGIKLGNNYFGRDESEEIITLIKEGFKNLNVSNIVNATYYGDDYGYNKSLNVSCTLYAYDNRVKTYIINSSINPELINYVMRIQNELYINNVKNEKININRLMISIYYDGNEEEMKYYYGLSDEENKSIVYKYINDNIKSDIDFSKYDVKDLIPFSIWGEQSYVVFLPRDEAFKEMFDKVKENVDNKSGQDQDVKEFR